jgi:hypothetical protein
MIAQNETFFSNVEVFFTYCRSISVVFLVLTSYMCRYYSIYIFFLYTNKQYICQEFTLQTKNILKQFNLQNILCRNRYKENVELLF